MVSGPPLVGRTFLREPRGVHVPSGNFIFAPRAVEMEQYLERNAGLRGQNERRKKTKKAARLVVPSALCPRLHKQRTNDDPAAPPGATP